MFAPLPILTLSGNSRPDASSLRPLDDYFGVNLNIGGLNNDVPAQTQYLTAVKAAVPNEVLRYMRDSAYAVFINTGAYPNWNTTASTWWKNLYQFPAPANFMTSYGTVITPPPPDTVQPPAQASSLGLVNLVFQDEFTGPINLYNPTATGSSGDLTWSPAGRWRHGPWYNEIEKPGFLDLAATKSFNVNPLLPDPNFGPLQSLSKIDATTMRITGRRINVLTQPASVKAAINVEEAIMGEAQNGTDWTGAWIGSARFYNDTAGNFKRPLYLEARARVPGIVQGVGVGFWMYTGGLSTNTHEAGYYRGQEVDILDISGYPATWTSHLHGEVVNGDNLYEGEYIANPDEPAGDWHVYGLLWQQTSLKIYRDNILKHTFQSPLIGGGSVDWYSDGMEIIISFSGHTSFPIDAPTNTITYDIDWVRCWK